MNLNIFPVLSSRIMIMFRKFFIRIQPKQLIGRALSSFEVRSFSSVPSLLSNTDLPMQFEAFVKSQKQPWVHNEFSMFESEISSRFDKLSDGDLCSIGNSLIKVQLLQGKFKVEPPTSSKILASKIGRTLISRIASLENNHLLYQGIYVGVMLAGANDTTINTLKGIVSDHIPKASIQELSILPSTLAALKTKDEKMFKQIVDTFLMRIDEDSSIPFHLSSFFRRSSALKFPINSETSDASTADNGEDGNQEQIVIGSDLIGAALLSRYLGFSPAGMVSTAQFIVFISESSPKALKSRVSALADAHAHQVLDRMAYLLNHPSENGTKRLSRSQAISIVTSTCQSGVSKSFPSKDIQSLAGLVKKLSNDSTFISSHPHLNTEEIIDLISCSFCLSSRGAESSLVEELLEPLIRSLSENNTAAHQFDLLSERNFKRLIDALTLSQNAPQRPVGLLCSLLHQKLVNAPTNVVDIRLYGRVLEYLTRPFKKSGLTREKAQLLTTCLDAFSRNVRRSGSIVNEKTFNVSGMKLGDEGRRISDGLAAVGIFDNHLASALLTSSVLLDELPYGSPLRSVIGGAMSSVSRYCTSRVVECLHPRLISQLMVDVLPSDVAFLKDALLKRVA